VERRLSAAHVELRLPDGVVVERARGLDADLRSAADHALLPSVEDWVSEEDV
jgi:hypothetical protein